MKNLKITSKTLMLTVDFPIEVGQLKTTATAHLHIYTDGNGIKQCEVEFMDQGATTYMGVSIDSYVNWQKFREFHKTMGIDYDNLIDKEFDKVWTKEFTDEFIKDFNF